MKKLFFILSIFSILISKSMFAKTIINGDYSFLQEITFQLYDDNVPPYKIPVRLKTLEETLMFEVCEKNVFRCWFSEFSWWFRFICF